MTRRRFIRAVSAGNSGWSSISSGNSLIILTTLRLAPCTTTFSPFVCAPLVKISMWHRLHDLHAVQVYGGERGHQLLVGRQVRLPRMWIQTPSILVVVSMSRTVAPGMGGIGVSRLSEAGAHHWPLRVVDRRETARLNGVLDMPSVIANYSRLSLEVIGDENCRGMGQREVGYDGSTSPLLVCQ